MLFRLRVACAKLIPRFRQGPGHSRELMRGTAVTFVVRVVGTGLAFAFNLALARLLGADGTGVFYLGMTVLTFSMVVGRLGLDNVVVRLTSAHEASRDVAAIKGIYQGGALLSLGASSVVALVMWWTAPWLASAIFAEPELERVLRYLSLAVVPASLLMHHSAALKGLSRVGWAALLQPHQGGVLVPAFALCTILIIGEELQATIASGVYLASLVLTTLTALVIWRLVAPGYARSQSARPIRTLLAAGIHLLWVSLANFATGWVPVILLGVFGTTSDVGIFGIAFRTAALTSFVLLAVNSIAAPKFAALYASRRIDELREVVHSSTRLLVFASLPILVVFLLVPEFVLSLFGDEFSTGGPMVLRILALGQFINVMTGSVNHLLMMTGREVVLRNIMLGGAGANLIMNVLLIPVFGMIGAAIATSITIAGINLYQVHISRAHFAINPLRWYSDTKTVPSQV